MLYAENKLNDTDDLKELLISKPHSVLLSGLKESNRNVIGISNNDNKLGKILGHTREEITHICRDLEFAK